MMVLRQICNFGEADKTRRKGIGGKRRDGGSDGTATVPLVTARFSGKTRNIPEDFRRRPLLLRNKKFRSVGQADTKFLLEGNDPEILPDAVQGDAEGMGFGGFVEHAVEAGLEEVELVEDGPLEGPVFVVLHGFQIAGQVAGVAAEGGGAQGVAGGQGAVRDPGQQGPVDLLTGVMGANGTTARHAAALRSEMAAQGRLREKVAGEGRKGQYRRYGWRGKCSSQRSAVGSQQSAVSSQQSVFSLR
jgi:hypothetical protein